MQSIKKYKLGLGILKYDGIRRAYLGYDTKL